MEGINTTQVWMLGVVGAMVIFGIAAAIGYYRNPEQTDSDRHSESND